MQAPSHPGATPDHVRGPQVPDPDTAIREACEDQALIRSGGQGLAGGLSTGQLPLHAQGGRGQVPHIDAAQVVASSEQRPAVGGQQAGAQVGVRGLGTVRTVSPCRQPSCTQRTQAALTCLCTGRWLSGNLSSATWPTRLHTLMPPLLQVNACLVKLLTARASTGSPWRSRRILCSVCGSAKRRHCRDGASGRLQESPESAGSQDLGRSLG